MRRIQTQLIPASSADASLNLQDPDFLAAVTSPNKSRSLFVIYSSISAKSKMDQPSSSRSNIIRPRQTAIRSLELAAIRYRLNVKRKKRYFKRFPITYIKQAFSRFSIPPFSRQPPIPVDDMFLHTNANLGTPLWKIKKKQKRIKAVTMFSLIQKWCRLSNGARDEASRDSLLADILALARSSRSLRCEIFLQLIKQTRGNADIVNELNTWSLFSKVSRECRCPEGISQVVVEYMKTAINDKREPPVIRHLAYEVLRKVGSTEDLALISPIVSECQVKLMDGTEVTLCFDNASTVSDLIAQMTWKLGIPCSRCFNLYTWREGEEQMVDRERNILSIIMTRRGSILKARMVPVILDREADLLEDSRTLSLLYHEVKDLYLRAQYPLDRSEVVKHCVRMIFAERGEIAFDQDNLAEILTDYLPKQNRFVEVEYGELVREVRTYFKRSRPGSKNEARIEFISSIDEGQYGNCVFFESCELVDAGRVAPLGKCSVGVNKNGVHIFPSSGEEESVSVELHSVISYSQQEGIVDLRIPGDPTSQVTVKTSGGQKMKMLLDMYLWDGRVEGKCKEAVRSSQL